MPPYVGASPAARSSAWMQNEKPFTSQPQVGGGSVKGLTLTAGISVKSDMGVLPQSWGGYGGGGGESLGAEAVTVIVSMLTVLPKPVARIARIVTEPDGGIVSVADEPASDRPLHVDEPERVPAVAYNTC